MFMTGLAIHLVDDRFSGPQVELGNAVHFEFKLEEGAGVQSQTGRYKHVPSIIHQVTCVAMLLPRQAA